VEFFAPNFREPALPEVNRRVTITAPWTAHGWIVGLRAIISGQRPGDVMNDSNHARQAAETGQDLFDLARFPSENPNPVFRVAGDGTLVYVNPAGSAAFAHWPLHLGEAAPPYLLTLAEETRLAGHPRHEEMEEEGRCFSFTFVPVGEAGYVNVYARDITKRKLAEREREQSLAELEVKNAELERFAYTVSHDLKAPLITILGFLGHLEDDLAQGRPDRLQGDILRIRRAAETMRQLLDDLLELSRIGRVFIPSEELPLAVVARDAVDLVAGPIAARGAVVEVSPDLPVVYGDRRRLVEVFENLLDNAVKFLGDQPQPRIEIGAREADAPGEPIVCYVRDNGIGIDPLYHEKVFGLFDKLDQQTEGAGVGLALVKRIVELHGGRIWVESEGQGNGSRFCFVIPH